MVFVRGDSECGWSCETATVFSLGLYFYSFVLFVHFSVNHGQGQSKLLLPLPYLSLFDWNWKRSPTSIHVFLFLPSIKLIQFDDVTCSDSSFSVGILFLLFIHSFCSVVDLRSVRLIRFVLKMKETVKINYSRKDGVKLESHRLTDGWSKRSNRISTIASVSSMSVQKLSCITHRNPANSYIKCGNRPKKQLNISDTTGEDRQSFNRSSDFNFQFNWYTANSGNLEEETLLNSNYS